MKVLHVTNLYPYVEHPTYGIFVKEQIDSLKDHCYNEVYFINARKNGIKGYINSLLEVRKICKSFDVIHCHHQFSGLIVVFSSFSLKKRKVLSILGDLNKRSFLNQFIFKLIYRHFNFIIFKNTPPSNDRNFLTIPNGVNIDFFKVFKKQESKKHLGLEINENIIHVLFVSNGSLENPIKRYDKFLVVLKNLNATSNVKYLPLVLSNISRENVPIYFNAGDVMILCSDHEGSPNAIKEAMACNLPVVSTPVGNVKELLQNVENSIVTEDYTVDSIVLAFKNLDLSKNSNGREKLIKMNLDQKSVATKIFNLYGKIQN
jgi:glycosyltransferase involved in cell wall biosynthesis